MAIVIAGKYTRFENPFNTARTIKISKLGARKSPKVVNVLAKMPRGMLSLIVVRSKIVPAIGPRNSAGAPSENARIATDEAEIFQEKTGTVKIRKKSIHNERDENPCI